MLLVDPPLASLVARARRLAVRGERRILGIAGPPGAGKSTLAEAVIEALAGDAVLVPMDGFHLPNETLVTLGLRDVKGAPPTFDAVAFVDLLRRLRLARPAGERAPVFRRDLDRSVADAIEIPARVPLVVTEGNYLLLDDGPWAEVRDLLDEAWYLAADERRVDRLIARHVDHGRTPTDARSWVLRSDEANAALVARTRERADLVIEGLPRS